MENRQPEDVLQMVQQAITGQPLVENASEWGYTDILPFITADASDIEKAIGWRVTAHPPSALSGFPAGLVQVGSLQLTEDADVYRLIAALLRALEIKNKGA